MSAKEKDTKKKENLKSFTVGSVQRGTRETKGAKATVAEKFEIREKDFPVLTQLRRSKDRKQFQQELQRVLVAVNEVANGGSAEEKREAQRAEKAYALALAVLEKGKLIR